MPKRRKSKYGQVSTGTSLGLIKHASDTRIQEWVNKAERGIADAVGSALFETEMESRFYGTFEPQFIYRRVIWQDVKSAFQKFLIITKDFLLIKPRSFSVSSTSIGIPSQNGQTVKPVRLWKDGTITVNASEVAGSSNTISSGGSRTKKKGKSLSGTKLKALADGYRGYV